MFPAPGIEAVITFAQIPTKDILPTEVARKKHERNSISSSKCVKSDIGTSRFHAVLPWTFRGGCHALQRGWCTPMFFPRCSVTVRSFCCSVMPCGVVEFPFFARLVGRSCVYTKRTTCEVMGSSHDIRPNRITHYPIQRFKLRRPHEVVHTQITPNDGSNLVRGTTHEPARGMNE